MSGCRINSHSVFIPCSTLNGLQKVEHMLLFLTCLVPYAPVSISITRQVHTGHDLTVATLRLHLPDGTSGEFRPQYYAITSVTPAPAASPSADLLFSTFDVTLASYTLYTFMITSVNCVGRNTSSSISIQLGKDNAIMHSSTNVE